MTKRADSRTPRRVLNKQEAARHLLHAAIRLIMKMEDPFAVHLLVHSADKIIIDVAKRTRKALRVSWEDYIKPEAYTDFFRIHRHTYHYFKHADRDFADNLPVHDIMMINIMTLFMSIANYERLFAEHTDHMTLFQGLVINIYPALIAPPVAEKIDLFKTIAMTQTMTPSRFFELFEENSQALPKFYAEVSTDCQDIIDFYHLSFSKIRAGETKSSRVFYLPEV